MLRLILLALAGVCATHAQLHPVVQFQNVGVFLRLRLPVTDNTITQVVFHYGVVGSASHTSFGLHAGLVWEHLTTIRVDTTDSIYAYADIHHRNGLTVTTPRTTHTPNTNGVANVVPGARRVRAIVFRDDFNSFNRLDWTREVSMFGGRNWEFQVYTNDPKNVFSRDGNLFLYPTLTVDDPRFDENFLRTGTMDLTEIFGLCTNNADYGCARSGVNGMLPPIMSGKVSSEAVITYGTIEIRAKIPKGDWLWPAIWMMPKKSVYGTWPRSGEMDIMETRGNDGPLGVGTISSTMHWGPAWNINKWDLTHGEKSTNSYHDDYHTYKLEWTGDHIRTSVDDQEILTVDPGAGFWQKGGFTGDNVWASGSKMAPFDQDFYLILNVAVGGTNGYFSDTVNWGNAKPWPNSSPHANEDFWNARNNWLPTWQGDNVAMKVDYVELRN